MAATDTFDGNTDKDQKDEAGAEEPKKKGRGKLVLVAIIIVLVAAGGAAGWFVLGGTADKTAEADDAPPVIEVPKELTYIDLQPIFIQVETDRGELQNVVVTLALELELDSKTYKKVEVAMPRLYEAYLRSLTNRPIPGAADGKVDVTHIKNRIRAENLRLLGPGAVYDVVLRNIWLAEG